MNSLHYFLVFIFVSFCVLEVCYGAPGGIGQEQNITAEVAALAETVKADAQTRLGVQFQKYDPISFASQVVNGVNYFIKIDVGDQTIIERVYRSFGGAVSLHSVKANLSSNAPITYFDCGGADQC